MKCVTFNIRCDYGQDGEYSFNKRKKGIEDVIKREKPDVIGFQEVLPHVLEWMIGALPNYYIAGCGREADLQGEHMVIAYRKDCAVLLGLYTFWLSPTPDIPGSRYEEQSMCPRICTVATLKIKEFSTPIRIYNTHLDHEEMPARLKGLEKILCQMESDSNQHALPAVLMGDFNTQPDGKEFICLKDHARLSLVDATSSVSYTFHSYGSEDFYAKIDYIFITPQFSCTEVKAWMDRPNDIYLSDHYPVCVNLGLVE